MYGTITLVDAALQCLAAMLMLIVASIHFWLSSNSRYPLSAAQGIFSQNRTVVKLTSPSIWICFTGESKVPPVEAITALDTEPDSLREAIYTPSHAEKGGKYLRDGCFRQRGRRTLVRVETWTHTIIFFLRANSLTRDDKAMTTSSMKNNALFVILATKCNYCRNCEWWYWRYAKIPPRRPNTIKTVK